MKEQSKYKFGEKSKEWSKKDSKELEVWQSPQYLASKEKAIEIIESGKYGLKESDFWILMNRTQSGKMAYTGLIISHNGCLKINDSLENKIDPSKFTIDKDGFNNSLVVSYVDSDVCEFGEYSASNCDNKYPYAMAFKRCFDRVVLKKSKLAYAGIYSDSEADEFTKQIEIIEEDDTNYIEELKKYIEELNLDKISIFKKFKLNSKSTNEEFKKALINLKIEEGSIN